MAITAKPNLGMMDLNRVARFTPRQREILAEALWGMQYKLQGELEQVDAELDGMFFIQNIPPHRKHWDELVAKRQSLASDKVQLKWIFESLGVAWEEY